MGSRIAWLLATALVLTAFGLALRYIGGAGLPLTVTVDGYRETIHTARPQVGLVLADLGLALRPEDQVQPPLSTPVTADMSVTVLRARRSLISVDGDTREVFSLARTVGEVLRAAGIQVDPHDEIWLEGQRVDVDATLPPLQVRGDSMRVARTRPWVAKTAAPAYMQIVRAVRIVVDDGSVPYALLTTAPTIGEALRREQVTLYLGDRVQPSLGSRVQAGLRVSIARSQPVVVTADGRSVRTRTQGKTVGDALSELGITVKGSDRVSPAMSTVLVDNMPISIVRVEQAVVVEREPIPYDSILVPDDELELDHQQLTVVGGEGEHRRRYEVIWEDGQEVSRSLTDDWVAAEPITRVTSYGRKIVPRSLDTAAGPLTYWRKVSMLATSYSPSTSGVSPSNPHFGRTRTGIMLTKGIVAVDPTLVPLGSRVYVPGYGVGLAADTGGAVRGKHIDLGFDDANLEMWYRWTDVYLLDAPPSPGRIRWILPNYPSRR